MSVWQRITSCHCIRGIVLIARRGLGLLDSFRIGMDGTMFVWCVGECGYTGNGCVYPSPGLPDRTTYEQRKNDLEEVCKSPVWMLDKQLEVCMNIEQELRDVIEKNLPAQVAGVFKSRLIELEEEL